MRGSFFIKIKAGFNLNDFNNLISSYNLIVEDVSNVFGNGVYKIIESREGSRFVHERAQLFFETNKCEFSAPIFVHYKPEMTNDPLFSQQWYLQNTGQNNGDIGADIREVPAWNFSKGENTTVAVVDNGVLLNHEDFRKRDGNNNVLQNNILSGINVINGLGGTVNANSLENPGFSTDYFDNHGTMCAGIIGAVADNNIGISGVAPNCKILPIKVMGNQIGTSGIIVSERLTDETLANGIIYAYQNNADVISLSLGWNDNLSHDIVDLAIQNAINLGRNGKGAVIVASAGNEGVEGVSYPSRNVNVISVGAANKFNQRLINSKATSNYGEGLSVVGSVVNDDIITFNFDGNYTDKFGGTSASCAQIAGVASLILSVNPNLTTAEVRKILEFSSIKTGNYCYTWSTNHPNGSWSPYLGYGRINAFNAVQMAQNITNLSNTVTYKIPMSTSLLTSTNIFGMNIINPPIPCSGITSSSLYYVKRHEVTKLINYSNMTNPLIICHSNGWSAANPNNGKNYATAINITNNSAVLKTWVYEVISNTGQNIGWKPTNPSNITFDYTIFPMANSINYQQTKSNKNIKFETKFEFEQPGGIMDNILNENIKLEIYPNPSNKSISIKNSLKTDEIIQKIKIYNNSNQLVFTSNNKKYNLSDIDVSKFKSGIYFIEITSNFANYNSKFVKN